MLKEIMGKLGWYMEEPPSAPVHGKLDSYNFSQKDLEAVSKKKELIYNERRKQK